ncbi:MAG TPA: glycosyltransferase [Candidatus Bilamarchaeum sp.]|nr:glycosyltransferase [Candidatus Bilamarchaeum sp.]
MDVVLLINYAIAFISLFTVSVFILIFLKHRDEYLERPKWSGKTPLVSIILPAYNEGRYLADCLRTIKGVDYPPDRLEVIVVDDGSTDDTYKIAKSFEGPDSPVKAFTKKNGGKGAALNFGIKKAKGEFVATMDADSYLTPGTLKELIPYFDDPEVMAATPAVKIRASGSWLKELQRVEYMMILFSRKLLSFIDSVPVTPGPFSMFRASVFEKIGPFDERNLVEDQEIALRIQSHNFRIRSSLSAEVYTEPPDNMQDLLKQRVRWQRGGIRNYWQYRSLIRPEYGDFGMYFVPLNFVALTAFFVLLGIMVYSIATTPYYVNYIWFDAFGMDVSFMTFVGAFVILTSTYFVYLAIKSFRGEKVKARYILTFMVFYWYLMVGYNLLFLFKELKREPYSW